MYLEHGVCGAGGDEAVEECRAEMRREVWGWGGVMVVAAESKVP